MKTIPAQTKTLETLFSTIFWVLILTTAIQFIGVIFITMSDVLVLFVDQKLSIEQYNSNPYQLLLTTIFWALVVVPLLKYALDENSSDSLTQQLAFKTIDTKMLFLISIVSIVYTVFEYSMLQLLNTHSPAFITSYVDQINSWKEVLVSILSVVVLAPIVEETIFRGVAYARLVNSRFGVTGAIVIPSIFFTLLHTQYEQITVFILIFISSILLGVIRHRTQNIWYSIVAHSLMNLFSLLIVLNGW